MQSTTVEPFKIIGISVRTTNQNNQAAQDIPALWEQLMTQNIVAKIPNKINDAIYSIYTNYEGDHTLPYDTILGCQVSTLDHIPEGMIGQSFEGGNSVKFTAKGNLDEGIVYQTWLEIWETNINRKFTADFEVYDAKAQNRTDAVVDIFVAVKE
ncbi:GyrI-like domain-containing protein [Aureispira anguillae]|uniref:GyrI-like domain-containing protein n=1 Tax=Aureispira anguillae TaxID=2864201 RepID=A0A915YGM0_9BACT|nr:GyrI-like domain-containing protein [Aureispira anguillae]BDS12675.1 GyrI-like domain-containing protein [Aureispira anguillae]